MSDILLSIKALTDFVQEINEKKETLLKENGIKLGEERKRAFIVIRDYFEKLNNSLENYGNEIRIKLDAGRYREDIILNLNGIWGICHCNNISSMELTYKTLNDTKVYYNDYMIYMIENWDEFKKKVESQVIETLNKNISRSAEEITSLAKNIEYAANVK